MIDHVRRHSGARTALIETEGGFTLSYAELADRVDQRAARLRKLSPDRALVFLAMGPDLEAIVLYLACLAADLPVVLVEPQAATLGRLVAAYAPRLLLVPLEIDGPEGYGPPSPLDEYSFYVVYRRQTNAPQDLHPDLALLLTTSGSTGSPKLVRLTRRNLESNAAAIVEYLGIDAEERAIQGLPSHYSYGLSVLNSHLWAGGAVVLTRHSFMRPEFWKAVDDHGCSSFAGVPYMYETLHRLRWAPARHPSLRTLTQAGGALRPDLTAHFHELALAARARFFVMYGQTEATARIAYVPPERLGEKIGSIGIPIPGGRLALAPVEGAEHQELVYQGPNVMMGYAETAADLALGDVQQGTLKTGDLGRVDGEGYFFLAGRLKRFAKLFGRRVSLEDIERELESSFPVRVAAVEGDNRIVLHAVVPDPSYAATLQAALARYLGTPPGSIAVRIVESLPMTSAGKKDYKALETQGTGTS